jgi:hypothetical protein
MWRLKKDPRKPDERFRYRPAELLDNLPGYGILLFAEGFLVFFLIAFMYASYAEAFSPETQTSGILIVGAVITLLFLFVQTAFLRATRRTATYALHIIRYLEGGEATKRAEKKGDILEPTGLIAFFHRHFDAILDSMKDTSQGRFKELEEMHLRESLEGNPTDLRLEDISDRISLDLLYRSTSLDHEDAMNPFKEYAASYVADFEGIDRPSMKQWISFFVMQMPPYPVEKKTNEDLVALRREAKRRHWLIWFKENLSEIVIALVTGGFFFVLTLMVV